MERLRVTFLMLSVLRAARQELAAKFTEEHPELFLDILRSRRGGEVANILLERHFLSWQLSHFEALRELIDSHDVHGRDSQELVASVASLVRAFTKGSQENNSSFFKDLLSERLIALESLIQVNGKTDRNISRLEYIGEKESIAIENLIKNLLQEASDRASEPNRSK